MSFGDTVAELCYALLDLGISVFVGWLLAKLGVLTHATMRIISDCNYYVIAPIYCLIYIMKAILQDHLDALGMLFFSSLSCVVVGFLITFAISLFINRDVRGKYSFIFIVVFSSLLIMPKMMADTTCGEDRRYASTTACKTKMSLEYSRVPLIFLMIVYWLIVLPILNNERRKYLELRKIFAVALSYYKNMEKFLDDKDKGFPHADPLNFDEDFIKRLNGGTVQTAGISGEDLPVGRNTESKLQEDIATTEADILRKPLKLEDEKFVQEFFQRTIDEAEYEKIIQTWEAFSDQVYDKPSHRKDREIIEAYILNPEEIRTTPEADIFPSLNFFKKWIVFNPPALWAFVGLILGLIFPFQEWFFDPENKPLPTFVGTLSTVGNMVNPITMFLVGAYIASNPCVYPNMLIRWKHIIAALVIRYVLLPLIGLLWVFVFMKNMDTDYVKEDPVMLLMSYVYWIGPNDIVLAVVYIVAEHFYREFAVITIFIHAFCFPMMIIFLAIFFPLYDNI